MGRPSRVADTPFVKLTGSVLWIVPVGLLGMVVVSFVFGHSSEPDRRAGAPPPRPSLMQRHHEHVTEEARTASRLIGRRVQNRFGDTVGRVKDLIIDEHSGRIVFVVLASGGFAGMAVRLKPVPPEVLSQATAVQHILALNMDPKSWRKAPVLHKSELAHYETPAAVQAIYQYYNCLWLLPTSRDTTDPNPGAEHFTFASALIGRTVINPQKEEVGHISDLAVDLDKTQMTRAIFKPLDGPKHSFIVPMGAFTIGGSGNLILNADPARLQHTRMADSISQAGNFLSSTDPIQHQNFQTFNAP